MAGLKHLILVESEPPVSFFGYPGRRSELAPEDCAIHVLASAEENGAEALLALARECGVVTAPPPPVRALKPEWPESGAGLTPDTIGRVLAHLLPDGAIVSEEAISSSEPILRGLAAAAAHDLLPITGGAIGQGLPVAVGAAVACPDRKVIALEADGSGLYTPQSLWTMARERLDVVVVILANRRYRILEIETRRTGAGEIGPRANDMMDLTRPDVDWVKLSEGFGVEAVRAATVSGIRRAVPCGLRAARPGADRSGDRVAGLPEPARLHLDEAIGLGPADGAVGRGFAEFDVAADRAQIESRFRQVLALRHGLQRAPIKLGVHGLGFHGVPEHAAGAVVLGFR